MTRGGSWHKNPQYVLCTAFSICSSAKSQRWEIFVILSLYCWCIQHSKHLLFCCPKSWKESCHPWVDVCVFTVDWIKWQDTWYLSQVAVRVSITILLWDSQFKRWHLKCQNTPSHPLLLKWFLFYGKVKRGHSDHSGVRLRMIGCFYSAFQKCLKKNSMLNTHW